MLENFIKFDSEFKDCEYISGIKVKNTERKITLFSKYKLDYLDSWSKIFRKVDGYRWLSMVE